MSPDDERHWLRRMREEEGFTLIELMVVVMILAILIVMGLPTFLGVKARFQDRAAQTDLRNTVLAARIMFTDQATFTTREREPRRARHHRRESVLRGWRRPRRWSSGAPACVSGAGAGPSACRRARRSSRRADVEFQHRASWSWTPSRGRCTDRRPRRRTATRVGRQRRATSRRPPPPRRLVARATRS